MHSIIKAEKRNAMKNNPKELEICESNINQLL